MLKHIWFAEIHCKLFDQHFSSPASKLVEFQFLIATDIKVSKKKQTSNESLTRREWDGGRIMNVFVRMSIHYTYIYCFCSRLGSLACSQCYSICLQYLVNLNDEFERKKNVDMKLNMGEHCSPYESILNSYSIVKEINNKCAKHSSALINYRWIWLWRLSRI